MKQQQEKQEEKGDKKVTKKINGERRFYLFTALGCAAALLAIVLVAVAVSGGDEINGGINGGDVSQNTPNTPDDTPDDVPSGNPDTDDEQVSGLPEGMIAPIATVSVSNEFGFYHNQTLNSYHEHTGVDFVAAVDTQVVAAESGRVESIYLNDLLTGTEIVIDHGDGLKTVYRFVDVAEGLEVGKHVEKGEVIATVAEANGNEYKDGAHLHFEVLSGGTQVDPTTYLTLEEK